MHSEQNRSFWIQSLPSELLKRPVKPELGSHYDVAIIGAGFSGLWLAYYLKRAEPNLNIAIFEAKHVAYGASGRNGGWLSTNIPTVIGNLFKHPQFSKNDVIALQRQVIATIDEVADVCAAEQIDCDLHKGGLLFISTNAAQTERLQEYYQQELEYGFHSDEIRLLNAEEAKSHINIPSMHAATHYQHGARIHPAKLALSLYQRLVQMGVTVFENSPVQAFSSGKVFLQDGLVNAGRVVCCTEGYSNQLFHDNKVIPVNSSIIMTEPLPEAFWQRFGWENNELLGDLAHLYIYAQKTRDKRILFGGRGAPYQYGGVDAGVGELDNNTQAQLSQRLSELFPDYPFQIACAWKGSLGVTRDWNPSVTWNQDKGVGFIYGFGGNGVGPTNLAARTMADRILAKQTDLTALPWNDYICPTWEGEPWRWLGIQSMYKLLGYADKMEYGLKLKKSAFFASTTYKICGLE